MSTYYSIPVVNGELDIDWNSDSFRVIHYNENYTIAFCEYNYGNVRDSWIEISEEEFLDNVPEEKSIYENINGSQEINQYVDQEYISAKILSMLFNVLVSQNDINEKISKTDKDI